MSSHLGTTFFVLCCVLATASSSASSSSSPQEPHGDASFLQTNLNVLVVGSAGAGKSRFVNAALRANGMSAHPAVVGAKGSIRPVTTRVARYCLSMQSGAYVCWYDTPALDVCPCLAQCGECTSLETLDLLLAGAAPSAPFPPISASNAAHSPDVVVLVSAASGPSSASCGRRLALHLANSSGNIAVPVIVVLSSGVSSAGLSYDSTPVFDMPLFTNPAADAGEVLAAMQPVLEAKQQRQLAAFEKERAQRTAERESEETEVDRFSLVQLLDEEKILEARLQAWPEEKLQRFKKGKEEDLRARELSEQSLLSGTLAVAAALLLRLAAYMLTTGVDRSRGLLSWCFIAGGRIRRISAVYAKSGAINGFAGLKYSIAVTILTIRSIVSGVITGSIFTYTTAVQTATYTVEGSKAPLKAAVNMWIKFDFFGKVMRSLEMLMETGERVRDVAASLDSHRRNFSLRRQKERDIAAKSEKTAPPPSPASTYARPDEAELEENSVCSADSSSICRTPSTRSGRHHHHQPPIQKHSSAVQTTPQPTPLQPPSSPSPPASTLSVAAWFTRLFTVPITPAGAKDIIEVNEVKEVKEIPQEVLRPHNVEVYAQQRREVPGPVLPSGGGGAVSTFEDVCSAADNLHAHLHRRLVEEEQAHSPPHLSVRDVANRLPLPVTPNVERYMSPPPREDEVGGRTEEKVEEVEVCEWDAPTAPTPPQRSALLNSGSQSRRGKPSLPYSTLSRATPKAYSSERRTVYEPQKRESKPLVSPAESLPANPPSASFSMLGSTVQSTSVRTYPSEAPSVHCTQSILSTTPSVPMQSVTSGVTAWGGAPSSVSQGLRSFPSTHQPSLTSMAATPITARPPPPPTPTPVDIPLAAPSAPQFTSQFEAPEEGPGMWGYLKGTLFGDALDGPPETSPGAVGMPAPLQEELARLGSGADSAVGDMYEPSVSDDGAFLPGTTTSRLMREEAEAMLLTQSSASTATDVLVSQSGALGWVKSLIEPPRRKSEIALKQTEHDDMYGAFQRRDSQYVGGGGGVSAGGSLLHDPIVPIPPSSDNLFGDSLPEQNVKRFFSPTASPAAAPRERRDDPIIGLGRTLDRLPGESVSIPRVQSQYTERRAQTPS